VRAAPTVETTPAPPVPSSRLAVLAIVALALGGFAIGTSEFVTMGLLPDIADGVRASIPSAGHLVSAYALGVVVGAPVIAALGARLPRRGLAVALMGAVVVGTGLSALSPGYGTLLLARFVAGLPHGRTSGWPRWSPPRWCPTGCAGGRSAR
jgi:DHA1 family inner membrane transport protein